MLPFFDDDSDPDAKLLPFFAETPELAVLLKFLLASHPEVAVLLDPDAGMLPRRSSLEEGTVEP